VVGDDDDVDPTAVEPATVAVVGGGGGPASLAVGRKRRRDRIAASAACMPPPGPNGGLVVHMRMLAKPRLGVAHDAEAARVVEAVAAVLERSLVRVACGTTLAHALEVDSAADVSEQAVACVEAGLLNFPVHSNTSVNPHFLS